MNVLAVGAHWDDIELGCCLTIGRLRERGATVYGVVLTDSETFVPHAGHARYAAEANVRHARSAEEANREGLAAFKALGIEPLLVRKEATNELRYSASLMQQIDRAATEKAVDCVFTHWPGDVNTDHRATWELSRVAFRNVRTLLCYRSNGYTDGVTEFRPNVFCGFSSERYEEKTRTLQLHATEWLYRKGRWQREIVDQERYWGHLIGRDYAEGFAVCRLMDPW